MARHYGSDFGFTVYDQPWLDGLTRLVADLRSTGAVVLVLGPVPKPQVPVPTCLSEHVDSASACAPDRTVAVSDPGVAAEEQATVTGGGRYENLTSLFCTASRCPVIVGDLLVFRDDNHVTHGVRAVALAGVLRPRGPGDGPPLRPCRVRGGTSVPSWTSPP
jgi:hypothetical protein